MAAPAFLSKTLIRFMNYLAHGYRFLQRPLFLAGTAVPDWLSVVNRKVRVRSRTTRPFLQAATDPDHRELAAGILQHHADDDRFHRSQAFLMLEARLAAAFRQHMPDRYDHRPGFLGHIVVELMLDATLARRHPELLDRFYAAMERVPEQLVEQTVNAIAPVSTDRLAYFIGRFREERFLYDYAEDQSMLYRLNQVMRRVRLPALEPNITAVLAEARQLVGDHADDLLRPVES